MLLQRLTVDTTLTQPFISFDASFSLASMHNTPLACTQVGIGGATKQDPYESKDIGFEQKQIPQQAEIAFYLKLRNFAGYGK